MSVSERAAKALERIGMTPHEIRAYSRLLAGGAATAQELSSGAEIPYSRVYDALTSLESKGWISSDGQRPARYEPRSPATGLEATRRRSEAMFDEDSRAITAELMPLYEGAGTSERPDILVITGVANIVSRVTDMVASCKTEILVTVPRLSCELLEAALPKLRVLRERGVRVTVLVSDDTDGDQLRSIARVADVHTRGGLYGGGVISDSRYVLILLGPEPEGPGSGPEGASSEIVAIWADHVGLAAIARNYFDYLLNSSEAPA